MRSEAKLRFDARRFYDPSVAHYEDHSGLIAGIGAAAYVYRCYDSDGVIVYVGFTVQHPLCRLQVHHAASWWPSVRGLDWAQFDDRFVAEEEETRQIHRWHPVGNRRCNGCGRVPTAA